VLKSIGLHHYLLSAIDEIQQDENRGIAKTARLCDAPTVTEDRLLTVLRKPDNLTYKSNDDRNIELDEQSPDHKKNSKFQSFCLNKTTRQYHKQHAKQSTDLRVTLTGP